MAHQHGGGTPPAGGTDTGRSRSTGRYRRLIRRFAAASLVATAVSQLVFVTSYTLGAVPAVATVLAQVSGAIPNFVINRRTWGGGNGNLRGQLLRFAAVSASTAVVAALATSGAEVLAVRFSEAQPVRVAIVWGAFIGTYAVMFVVKFLLIDRLVFPARRDSHPRSASH